MEMGNYMDGIIKNSLSRKRKPGDYIDDDGLLICGTCGKPLEMYIEILGEQRKVGVQCDCDILAEKEEAMRKQQQENMQVVQSLRSASLMDEKFASITFDRFEVTEYNAYNLRLCKRYATGFDAMLEKNQGLLMYGEQGTGKTFAASCIANYLLSQKYSVVMTSLVSLMERFERKDDEMDSILARMNKVQLLILDDLGAERNSSYALEKVYKIIDGRYRSNRPMIITTNLTVDEMLQEQDRDYARIYDRIFEACSYPMEFTGPSWRKKAASQRFEAMKQFLEGGKK